MKRESKTILQKGRTQCKCSACYLFLRQPPSLDLYKSVPQVAFNFFEANFPKTRFYSSSSSSSISFYYFLPLLTYIYTQNLQIDTYTDTQTEPPTTENFPAVGCTRDPHRVPQHHTVGRSPVAGVGVYNISVPKMRVFQISSHPT